MGILDLAQLYVSSRVLSSSYAEEIIRTARRFQAANGSHDVSQIGPLHISRFLQWIIRHTANRHTQSHYMARLAILLRFAKELRLIAEIPPLPKITRPHKTPKAWNEQDFRRLYAIANTLDGRVGVQLARIWWPSLIATAYHTASRIGALLSVRWSDFDLSRSILVLRAENTKTKREQLFTLPEYVTVKIKAMEWPKRDLVWEWPHTRRWFFRKFRKILRMVDLEPPPNARFSLFHQIRRTSATVAAQHLGIQAAQTLLGHASARITIEHYIDPSLAGRTVALPSLE